MRKWIGYLLVGLASAGWVWPLYLGVNRAMWSLINEQHVPLSYGLEWFRYSMLWLGLVIVVWAAVATRALARRKAAE